MSTCVSARFLRGFEDDMADIVRNEKQERVPVAPELVLEIPAIQDQESVIDQLD